MSKFITRSTVSRARSRRQAIALLTFGIVFLVLALILRPNPLTYPLGLLLFGLGMLIAAFINPYRLMIAGILVTLIGLSIFSVYKKDVVPDAGGSIVLAIGLGLAGIALAARRGYVTAGALTPAIIVLLVGLVEYGPTDRLLPSNLASIILSLWFPGLGLLLLGLIYLFIEIRR